MFRSGTRDQHDDVRLAEIRRGGVVPDGSRALPLEGAAATILVAGQEIPSPSLVVPVEALEVVLSFPDLADREGVRATLELRLVVDPPDGSTGLRLLAESLRGRDAYRRTDLAADLAPLWLADLRSRVAQIAWADDESLADRLELRGGLPGVVQEALFDRGLRLESIRGARARSEELARAVEERRLRREEATRIRDRLDFLELWQKEREGEALARSEVERMAHHLEQQGMLRKIVSEKQAGLERLKAEEEVNLARERLNLRLERERLVSKLEIDAERLEKELALAEQLQSAFEKNGWLALVQAIDDPEGQARLLERLIEKEMTPEQLAARGVPYQHVERLEAQITAIQASLLHREVPRGLVGPVAELAPIRRVWLAAGLALYRVDGDPTSAEREARPVLPPEEIGYLRSIRIVEDVQGVMLAVGGQGGVGIYRPDGSHWEIFRFRPGEAGRGGANAVFPMGAQVVATHSRLGLTVWDRRDARSLRRPLEAALGHGRSTRAVQATCDGSWLFACGSEVYRVASTLDPSTLESLGALPQSVTSLHRAGEEVWAGTQDGRIHRFEQGRWHALPFATSGPIYQIRALVGRDGARIWLVGARQPALHVLDDRGGRLADYRSRYPIRWVDGGGGGPVAVDRFGQHLIVWNWEDPDSPAGRIRVPDQIHAIAVERGDA